ncbi:hypothetical protein [Hydrogenovibrio marinus]|uniref:Uncharacterized protein n=1 Tax=Hydrogenovibrio marinus TaxID=28885 RepID=A0A066ZMI9_HYDMR|nr:hypothetical protein [Hydrogenovibrio marinus]KDN94682.1 hypothetical protein EI16_12345 [Hydrogenovibrio marinus]
MNNNKQELLLLATQARTLGLMPLKDQSEGACLYIAFFLKFMLSSFQGKYEAHIRGGGNGDSGTIDVDGTMQGHYWVEVKDMATGESFIVDPTADQFGYDKVVIIPLRENDRYFPGSQTEIDNHVDDIRQDLTKTAQGLFLDEARNRLY